MFPFSFPRFRTMFFLDDVKVIDNLSSLVFGKLLNVNVATIEDLHVRETVVLDNKSTKVHSVFANASVQFTIAC